MGNSYPTGRRSDMVAYQHRADRRPVSIWYTDMSINPPTDDIPKSLTAEDATSLRLLRSAPERWTRLVRDDLTAEESVTLRLLGQGGLVDVESRLRMSMAGHPVGFEITLESLRDR